MTYCSRIDTPLGRWEILASETGVTRVFPTDTVGETVENTFSRQGAEELLAYFAGTLWSFSVPLDLAGTPFQRQVWAFLRGLPWGQTICYSDVAQALGKPKSVRAVANAIGRNPCLILIPCHRVLGKDGSLTGFSAGLERKKQLLDLEQIAYRKK